MGRRPWSNRLLVQDCQSLKLPALAQAGVFQSPPGKSWTCTWEPISNEQIPSMQLRFIRALNGDSSLELEYSVAEPGVVRRTLIRSAIRVQWTPCRFGGCQPWLICPLPLMNGLRCKRRVRILYLLPGGRFWGCRLCHRLTYASVKSHDARADRLADDPAAVWQALQSWHSMVLAAKALQLLRARLQRHGKKRDELLKAAWPFDDVFAACWTRGRSIDANGGNTNNSTNNSRTEHP